MAGLLQSIENGVVSGIRNANNVNALTTVLVERFRATIAVLNQICGWLRNQGTLKACQQQRRGLDQPILRREMIKGNDVQRALEFDNFLHFLQRLPTALLSPHVRACSQSMIVWSCIALIQIHVCC
jgi:hypothetical protein